MKNIDTSVCTIYTNGNPLRTEINNGPKRDKSNVNQPKLGGIGDISFVFWLHMDLHRMYAFTWLRLFLLHLKWNYFITSYDTLAHHITVIPLNRIASHHFGFSFDVEHKRLFDVCAYACIQCIFDSHMRKAHVFDFDFDTKKMCTMKCCVVVHSFCMSDSHSSIIISQPNGNG